MSQTIVLRGVQPYGESAVDLVVSDGVIAEVAAAGSASGERVLDVCAAPGGKTMQLAAKGANVVALDISEPRLKRLRENLERAGLVALLRPEMPPTLRTYCKAAA